MKSYRPERVFVERSVKTSRISLNVLDRIGDVRVQYVDSSEGLLEDSKRWNPTIPRAKQTLVLAEHRGNFFKPCPAGRTKRGVDTVCCNYFVINYASNCHMECSYCYLQSYLNFPHMVIYANYKDLLSELEETFRQNPQHSFRIGTGELADSLALDPLTSYSVPLVNFFARQKNAILEFKTKSDCIENLLHLDHQGKTVVSWSINPPFIQQQEEHKTASVRARVRAAVRCVEAGYRVGFHLDPLVAYPSWRNDYRDLIARIFFAIAPESIAWISVGSLRMTKQLRELVKERFPNSFLPFGELVPTEDGKMRYFKPIRIAMYREIWDCIRDYGPHIPVYACMERPDVWRKVFETAPPDETELGAKLTELLL